MLPEPSRRKAVFFWDENGRVGKGWTTGKPLVTGWVELELARGIRESGAGCEQVPLERVLPTTAGVMEGCSTVYLQNILDQIIARNPLRLLQECLAEEWKRLDTSTSMLPRDPDFWQRWEWLQMLVLRHPPQLKTVDFSVVERDFAVCAAQELARRYGNAMDLPVAGKENEWRGGMRDSDRVGEYAGQLPCLAALGTKKETAEGLQIDHLAKMIARLIRRGEEKLQRRISGGRTEEMFQIHLHDFVSAYPGEVNASALTHWLAARAVVPGEWKERSPASLYQEYPLRWRPLIRLEEEVYAWPLLAGAARHVWDWLFARSDDQRNRESPLCDRAVSLFQQAFPEAAVYKQVHWWSEHNNGTLDAVVHVPPFLFTLWTETPFWGDLDQFRSSLYQEQIKEFAPLRRAWNSGTLKLKAGNELIPIHEGRLVEMVISLESWQNRGEQADSDLPLIYSLSELQNLFYLLDGSARKADYLWKRVHSRRGGEEWQHLSAYWLTGSPDRREANMGKKRQGTRLEPFLPYLERAWAGKRVTVFEEGSTHWWNAILRKLEHSKTPEALWIGTHLLGVDVGTQNRFERELKRLKKAVCRDVPHSDPIVFNDFYRVAGAIVDPEQEREHPIYLRHKGLRKRLMSSGDPWVLISLFRDDTRYPYSCIQLLQ
ncbi:hypothetical protein [Desmospora activa]|uniref:Uncharacterized protein n=1 Tax=Desmospora activa DSM 45169 TaxID=1121389 RepID=A0A2T4Z3M9_9BACL|nr:hypothetical protein [Desmospora activa]PTM56497.1 hypothetical protein C8J48_2819 [Desmospora activa DSM 45169]